MAEKVRKDSTLIIDIGTAVIAGGLYSRTPRHGARISSVKQLSIGSGTFSDRESLVTGLDVSLKTLVEMFAKERVSRVRVVLAAPWHTAQARTVTSVHEETVPVSEKSIIDIVHKHRDEQPPATGAVDIEAVATQVRVNGYHTRLTRPVAGKEVEVNLYESEVDPEIEKRVQSAVWKVFPNAEVSFTTFPLAAVVALRNLSREDSFTIVDCSGEMTEVAVVHEGGIGALVSFPIGYYGVARTVAGDGAPADALSRLSLFARGELSEAEQARVEAAFTSALEPWVKKLEESMRTAANAVPIPRTLYLLSSKESLPWLAKGLVEKSLLGVSVTPVSVPMIQNALEIGEGDTYDVFLSLDALFFHIHHPELFGE